MHARALSFLMVILVVAPAARAQLGAGSAPGEPTRLAQFQPGLSPLGSNLDLAPGRPVRLALYCADLFAATPTDRVAFTAPSGDATVTLASGREVSLGDALAAGMVRARGRGAGEPPRREGGRWDQV